MAWQGFSPSVLLSGMMRYAENMSEALGRFSVRSVSVLYGN